MKQLIVAAAASSLAFAAPAAAGPVENKALVEHFIHDVFQAKDPDAAARYLAPGYVQHNPHVAPGLAGFQASMREWFAHAPPDLSDEILHLVAEGDKVVAHNRLSYTGKDGRKVSVTGFDLYRIEGGRIVEHWDSDQ